MGRQTALRRHPLRFLLVQMYRWHRPDRFLKRIAHRLHENSSGSAWHAALTAHARCRLWCITLRTASGRSFSMAKEILLRRSTMRLRWHLATLQACHQRPDTSLKNLKAASTKDMMQKGYAEQWGPTGRNDLGLMKACFPWRFTAALGTWCQCGSPLPQLWTSRSRLSSDLLGSRQRAEAERHARQREETFRSFHGGFHSTEPAMCENFDCFKAWKAAALEGFQQGRSLLGEAQKCQASRLETSGTRQSPPSS